MPTWQDAKDRELRLSVSDAVRFWTKVRIAEPDACWEWQASVFGGPATGRYGQFTVTVAPGRQRHVYAHRIAWTLRHGAVPVGSSVLHRCDNPLCANPAHLFLGTQLDNMRDASLKGRLSLPRRANRATMAAVRQRWQQGGVTQRQLATDYGVSPSRISAWLRPVKARPYQRMSAAS